ncbi:MAG: prepilin-type N-terminal cleavage/methylation domain-containing protein [Candidatus Niyogibacteria bacterium]|nr:prepilin-type N-terminal cleavage/methylation domain-containing protein [Candidatus Niyogibacteria bacterium]
MNKGARSSDAFTIVEMLVSISIFTIITSLVLTNYPKFSEHFALERTAQEVAQSFREAKTLSLAVTVTATELAVGTKTGYGVHFEQNSKNYLIFSDIYPDIPNKIFDVNSDRIDSSYNIQADATVTGFCAGNDCILNSTFQMMDIVFTRPEPAITFFAGDSGAMLEQNEQNISIFITNGKGETKRVVVWKSGQISVK